MFLANNWEVCLQPKADIGFILMMPSEILDV